MEKNQVVGIENILNDKKKPELKDIRKIHSHLMHQYPMPKIKIEKEEKLIPGAQLKMRMRGIPLPAVDVYKGKLIKTNTNDPGIPIYASFRTTTGTTLTPLKHLVKDMYSVILPEKVTNGLVGLMFPVQEIFGPKEVLDNFPEDIQKWIKRSKHISRSSLSKEDCPTLTAPYHDYRYLAMIIPKPLRFSFSATCNICPFGALKVAADYCHIDPILCRGQKYSRLNGLLRGPEEICWSCFNAGDGAVSTKCDYVTIRKVLHLNPDEPKQEVPCCGGCEIRDLCSRGAIYKPPTYPRFFTADKKKCNGCMECYLNKDCPWNCGTNCSNECEYYQRDFSTPLWNGTDDTYTKDVHNNYTMRMVAQIDEKLKVVLAQLSILYYLENYSPWPRPYDGYYNWHDNKNKQNENDFDTFDLIIWGDKTEKIPIKLDKTGVQRFDFKEIPFTKSIHLGLFEKDGKILGFSHCGSDFPIQSLGAKRYSDPTKIAEGGTFNFNSPMGRIEIDYLIK